MTPAIFGLSGLSLTDDERAFFRAANPAGYILFAHNVAAPDQVRALTAELRALSGRDDLPILIDQEGGRVARMKPPHWPAFPAGAAFDHLYDLAPASAIAAAQAHGQALAVMLRDVGISVDCTPLLDVRQPGASDVIGDRALGSEPMRVAALGRAILVGLRGGGVVGVVKHLPGHGRALVDTHDALPVVEASTQELAMDIAPFTALAAAPMGMVAHIIYTAWDADRCASLSPTIIQDVIRKQIGFDGLLMTDDMDMKAMRWDATDPHALAAIAAQAITAGCDIVLNCWGKLNDMDALADRLDPLSAGGHARLDRAMAQTHGAAALPPLADLVAQRDALLALA